MNLTLAFAGYAVQELALHFERLTREEYASIDALSRKKAPGAPYVEFAQLPYKLLPKELATALRSSPTMFECEIMQIAGNFAPHYHRHSGGVMKILGQEQGTGGLEILLDCSWHSAMLGEIIILPAGMVHGFRFNEGLVNRDVWAVSVNIPPLAADDTVYV